MTNMPKSTTAEELKRTQALLAASEAERLELKRRYIELGERFERLLSAEESRRVSDFANFERQAAEENRQTAEKLAELMDEVERQRGESAEKLRIAEESLANSADLTGLLEGAANALKESEARLHQYKTRLADIIPTLAKMKLDLVNLRESLRSEKLSFQDFNIQAPSIPYPSLADISCALAQGLRVDFVDNDFADTATLARKIQDSVNVKLDLTTDSLRAEFSQLREEAVALRDAWLAEREEFEHEVTRLKRQVGSPVKADSSFEVGRLSRECRRLEDLLSSRESQLSQLMESRQCQLKATLSRN